MQTKIIPISILCLLFTLVSICPCKGEKIDCSIQIEVSVSSFPPFQSVAPIVVSVELRNKGNVTFNGTLTIYGRTDKDHSYSPIDYSISNLTKNEVLHFSRSFAAYDEGIYWFRVELEPNEIEVLMQVYEDSTLIDQTRKATVVRSIVIHSFTEFLMIVGIAITIISVIVGFVVNRQRKAKRKSYRRTKKTEK